MLTLQQLQAQYDAISAAIALGATRATYGDKTVEYRTLAEMRSIRNALATQLGIAGPSRRTVATFSGGFG